MADETIEKTGGKEFDIVTTEQVRVAKTIKDLKADKAIYKESRDSWQAKMDKVDAQILDAKSKGVVE